MESYFEQRFSFIVTFTILFSVMVIRYFSLSGLLYVLVKNKVAEVSRYQVLRDIKWSVLSSVIFAFFGTLLLRLWQAGTSKIYLDINDYPYWYLPVGLIVYLFIHDTYFYWTHRWMHVTWFKRIHFAHHESRYPTAWTSFAFHPYEAVIQAIILPLLVLFIPIHIGALIVFLMIMSVFGITNHLGYEIYPEQMGKKYSIITSTHHQIHHQKMGYNFGLYFSLWDKWMGTEHS